MARRKNGEKEQLWRERVERQAVSGLSIRHFCDQERISQPSFYAWRRHLRERAGAPTRRAVASRTVAGRGKAEPRKTGNFIPLRRLDTPTAWEVVHPHGYRVRVSGEVSATALQCIVGVLDGTTHG